MEGSGRRGRLRFGVRLGNICMVRDDLLVTKVKVHVVGEKGRCCEALEICAEQHRVRSPA